MTENAQGSGRITRPGASVAVDSRKVLLARQKKFMKRWQMSQAIAELGLTDEHGRPVTMGVDFLGKVEAGTKKPGLDTFKAMCIVLDCEADALLPGGRPIALTRALRERRARLDNNRHLREFATPRGLRYKNPVTGRVYYGKLLREAYALHLELLAARDTGDEAAVAAAQAAYDAALAKVPRAGGDEAGDEDDDELLAS